MYAARIVGEGGFQKVVALKRMLPTLAEDERFVTMFLDEGRLAANISSPNVVQTLDLGRADDDSLYLVMELVVGVPLGRLIRGALKDGSRLSPEVSARILAEAARGLHDAHEATTPLGEPLRIIHRDVSPQNILVDRAGRTRITDFGVARAMQRHGHTQTGELKGKMAYFAPEQAVGGEIDRRLDVFALGIVAWETLCGRRLFRGDNPLMTLKKITEAPVPSIRQYRTDVPAALDEAIQKALQRKRDDRWPTALDFARALEAAVGQPASAADVAENVRAFGGAPLADLDRKLKLALSGEIELPEPAIDEGLDDAPTTMERTPLSTSAIVPTAAAISSTGSLAVAPAEHGSPKWCLGCSPAWWRRSSRAAPRTSRRVTPRTRRSRWRRRWRPAPPRPNRRWQRSPRGHRSPRAPKNRRSLHRSWKSPRETKTKRRRRRPSRPSLSPSVVVPSVGGAVGAPGRPPSRRSLRLR